VSVTAAELWRRNRDLADACLAVAAAEDFEVCAAKTGALGSAEITEAVAAAAGDN